MDILTQQKFLKWAVIILVIINLSTLTFLWVTKPVPPNKEMRPAGDEKAGPGLLHFLKEELKLNEAQADSILRIRNEQNMMIRPVIEKIHMTKKQLVDGVFENWDQDNDSLTSEIGWLQSKIEMMTFNYLERIKNVLGPDQKENLKKLVGGFFLNDRRPPDRELPRGERKRPPVPLPR